MTLAPTAWGTSNRHGAVSVVQFELNPIPPEHENKPLYLALLALKLRTSSSHKEGCGREFSIATKEFIGENGKVTGLKTVRVELHNGKFEEIIGSEQVWPADQCLAMGFTNPVASVLTALA